MNDTYAGQARVDDQNTAFWDEMCGTNLAFSLGIKDDSKESLARYDAWYFNLYPYLDDYIPFQSMGGKDLLEIGLGYGSVSQRLAASGSRYHGLDIASGPVAMVSKRLKDLGVEGNIRQGSILQPPFTAESFDWAIAIGCLHHTGNLAEAIRQVHRLLKPGGEAVIMVYSASSYRQWHSLPMATLKRVFADPAGYADQPEANALLRGSYDTNSSGVAAPQTEFVTKAELRHLCRAFSRCAIVAENIGTESLLRFIPRKIACALLGPVLGLDLYCRLKK